ncbi:uncharacterized protein LOC135225681 [Macrobrachium nipponense]|uniref:uncharacterized protein LOC135225681 n=1 Tax=Macrobrachium nipponense TaxID=159736 RepID=UPI0030C7ABEF
MTRRAARRRRMRRRRQRRTRARRRGRSSRNSEPVDCSCFGQMNDSVPSDNRSKRAFFIGGTCCIAIGVMFFFISDETDGSMNINGFVFFVAGVIMLACLIRILARSDKAPLGYHDGLTGVTVEQPRSSQLHPPPIPAHSPGALPPPSIPPHATVLGQPPMVPPHGTGTFLPSPAGTGPSQVSRVSVHYPGGGPQVAGYPPTFIGQTSRNPSPVSWRTSRNLSPASGHNSRNSSPVGGRASRNPSPVGGWTSRNPSPVIGRNSRNPSPFIGRPLPDPPSDRNRPTVQGGDPPPYTSVVSAKPWVDPPSYQEASSCLVPRADTNGAPAPSAPDISIAVEQYPSTSPPTSADPAGPPSDRNPNESEHPPSAPLLP